MAETATKKENQKEFKKAVIPLLKFLNTKCNPHTTAIITATRIELVTGVCVEDKIYEYLVD